MKRKFISEIVDKGFGKDLEKRKEIEGLNREVEKIKIVKKGNVERSCGS